MPRKYSRREMLKMTGLVSAGLLASACAAQPPAAPAETAAEQPEGEAPALQGNVIWDTFRGVGTG